MGRGLVLWSLGLMAALSACGSPAQPPKPVSAPPKSPAPVAAVAAAKPAGKVVAAPPQAPAVDPQSMAQALTTARVRYEGKGRRDPFENIETRIQQAPASVSVTATKLTAIVRGRTRLALVEDAKGVGYILKPGDTLGDGRVIEIGDDSVVFAVAPKPGSTANRVVLRIAAD